MSADQMEDIAPAPAENGSQETSSKEAIMSREQAEKMNKDLKHYSYVPVLPKEEEPLPAKRQRKKINYKEIAQPSIMNVVPKKATPKKGSKSKKSVSPSANIAAAPATMAAVQPAADAPATDLERKKLELQAQLEAINRSLQDLGNQLQQTTPVGSKRKSPESSVKSTPTKKPTNRKSATPKAIASDVAYTPVKSSPAKDKKGRPTRDRKKSIPGAFEIDEPAVKLTPGLKTCRRILLQLMAHHFAFPFNRPVDPVELQIPDYPTIIKNPMDLGTIKSKLDNGEYETVFEFSDDVYLTFNNAMVYNMPGSDVYVMADTLLKEFQKKFKSTEKRQLEKSTNPYSPAYSDYGRKEVVPRGTPTKSGRIPKPKMPKKSSEAVPLTREEKVKLSATINKLPAESLMDVLHIIQQSMPQISDQVEEIEIDIDSLDTYTLRRLEKCVKNGMRKAKKTPKKRAAPPSRLEQAELAQMGTQQKIEDVEREIKALTNSEMAQADQSGETKTVKKGGDEDVVIDDDDIQPSQYPPVVIDKEKSGSESDSGSDSSTSSESGSGSDSNSDTESAQSPAIKKVVPPTKEEPEVEAPQIISTSATIKTVAIENAASWRQSVGSSAEEVEIPLQVEPSMKATANLSWSQFQHKDNLMKQREKEKLEREEMQRKERIRQEEERRKEEERKIKEKEQDEIRRKEEEQKQAEEEQKRKEEERLRFLQTLEKEDDEEEDDTSDMVMLKQLGAGSMSLDSMASLLSKSGTPPPCKDSPRP